MAGITTAFVTSYKTELPQALHNHTGTTGHVFKAALIVGTPAGTYGTTTTNYSTLTGNSDEVSGAGYTAGGFAWTAVQNLTPASSGIQVFYSWSVNPSWGSATFTTGGMLIYNTSSGNRCCYIGSFGGPQSVSAGSFTVVLPGNGPGTAILQLN